MIKSVSLFHLVSLSLAFSLMTSCATAKIAECNQQPQASRDEPESVQKAEMKLPDTELSDAQKVRYAERQAELKTLAVYHDIVLHPQETLKASTWSDAYADLKVEAPIFLIGLEKPRANAPDHVSSPSCEGRDFKLDALPKDVFKSVCFVMSQGRPQLLTHIAKIDGVSNGQYGKATFVYNAYDEPLKDKEGSGSTSGDEALYGRAIGALGDLSSELQKALTEADATDVVVMSTGWNTRQRETLYNTMDWMAQIGAARSIQGRPYRPLYITISWQSAWEEAAFNAIKANVANKGNDADELGLTWVNRLVNDVVIPAASQRGVHITFVGHSYGTRVLGSALYFPGIIRRTSASTYPSMAFVALQPAFPINRFGEKVGKERWFAGVNPHALVVLTSSENDSATSALPWGRYVGGGGAKDRVLKNKNGNLNAFGCEVLKADASGLVLDPTRLTTSRPHLVDASAFVSCHMPQTGGGAHSDVFDASAGRLIAQVMDAARKRSEAVPSETRCK